MDFVRPSYLMYWKLGAWFQIYKELEDQGGTFGMNVVFFFFSGGFLGWIFWWIWIWMFFVVSFRFFLEVNFNLLQEGAYSFGLFGENRTHHHHHHHHQYPLSFVPKIENKTQKTLPSLTTNTLHLKMDGWKTFSFWDPAYFQVPAVKFRECVNFMWLLNLAQRMLFHENHAKNVSHNLFTYFPMGVFNHQVVACSPHKNPTQLYGDYFINHEIRIPSLNNPGFNRKCLRPGFFNVVHILVSHSFQHKRWRLLVLGGSSQLVSD